MQSVLKHKCTSAVALRCTSFGMGALSSAQRGFLPGGATHQQLFPCNNRRHPGGQSAGRMQLHTTAAAAATYADASAGVSTTDADSGRPRVCILGGGFGGLYTAIKLELLMWPKGKKPKVTLIDQGERFIFKPLLYELINGTAQSWEVAPTFNQLLAPYPIQFVQDKVLEVQPEQTLRDGGSATGGTVRLASGALLEYDWLIVSLGAAADPRGVPGVKEHAHPFVSLEDAEFVAQRLSAFEARAALGQQQATVVVVGAGYAGVELAAVVGERVRGKAQVVLMTPGQDILQTAPPGQREAATQALRALGVSIMTGTKVTGVEEAAAAAAAAVPVPAPGSTGDTMDPVALSAAASGATPAADAADDTMDSVSLSAAASGAAPAADLPGSQSSSSSSSYASSSEPSYIVRLKPATANYSSGDGDGGGELAADLVLWTAGSRAASQPLQPFPCDARGQLETDPTLRVARHARVFALGDVSKGQPEAGDGTAGNAVYPATAQVAFQQADYAAWNVWAAINGRPLLPFRYQHLGDMMSLGATNAAVALPFQLPSEVSSSIASSPLGSLLSLAGLRLDQHQQGGVTLEGPLAQLLRRAAYLYRQPTNEQRINVAASWLQQAADAAAGLAAEVSRGSGSGVGGSRRW